MEYGETNRINSNLTEIKNMVTIWQYTSNTQTSKYALPVNTSGTATMIPASIPGGVGSFINDFQTQPPTTTPATTTTAGSTQGFPWIVVILLLLFAYYFLRQ